MMICHLRFQMASSDLSSIKQIYPFPLTFKWGTWVTGTVILPNGLFTIVFVPHCVVPIWLSHHFSLNAISAWHFGPLHVKVSIQWYWSLTIPRYICIPSCFLPVTTQRCLFQSMRLFPHINLQIHLLSLVYHEYNAGYLQFVSSNTIHHRVLNKVSK